MKHQTLIKIVVSMFAVVTFSFLAYANTRIPPSNMPELSTTWIGWADTVDYFRLELKADGTGLCALYERTRSNSRLYAVSKWTLKDYDIEIILRPIDADAWPVTIKGTATSNFLHLQFGDGRRNGWRAKATFERESAIESAMESAKSRMQDYSRTEVVK